MKRCYFKRSYQRENLPPVFRACCQRTSSAFGAMAADVGTEGKRIIHNVAELAEPPAAWGQSSPHPGGTVAPVGPRCRITAQKWDDPTLLTPRAGPGTPLLPSPPGGHCICLRAAVSLDTRVPAGHPNSVFMISPLRWVGAGLQEN